MAEKTLNARIQMKTDTEANWLKKTDFVPKIGEIIIYAIDATHSYQRIKVGDGTKKVNELPFINVADSELSSTSTNAIQNKVVALMKTSIDDALGNKLGTITISGDGNTITEISKSETTINAEKNAFATTVKEGNLVSEISIAGAGFSVETTFEPKQEGSGNPSPDNIRLITGWNAMSMERCGKNLLDTSKCMAANLSQTYGLTVEIDGDIIRISGVPNITKDLNNAIFRVFAIKQNALLANKNNLKVTAFDANDIINQVSIASDGYFTIQTPLYVGQEKNCTFRVMVSYDTATSYEPYSGNEYTATLLETVYGGKLDWNTGVLTVDRHIVTLTGEENSHIYSNIFYLAIGQHHKPKNLLAGISSHYLYSTYAIGRVGITADGESAVYKPNGDYTSDEDGLNEWKAYLAAQYAAGTPVQIVYEIDTPYTTQLTPHDLRMLDGTNTVYSNGNTNYVIFNSGISSLGKANELFFKKTDIVPVSNGGTEATSASDARANLEVPSKTGEGASGTWNISISGNASTATKTTQDSAGQQINTTYIKGLSVSGKTITYTKGDGTTGTITIQDASAITNAEIDEICNATIYDQSEVQV